jgi:Terpene synthase family 2, C-terminal metal binding
MDTDEPTDLDVQNVTQGRLDTALPEFTLPKLELPFPSKVNRFAAPVAQSLLDMAIESRVLQPSAVSVWSAAHYELLAARMYPGVPERQLGIIAEALVWLFLLDDYLDDRGIAQDPVRVAAVVQGVRDVLGGTEPSEEPLLCWLWHWRRKALQLAPAGWWARCVRNLDEFAAGLGAEALARTSNRPPDMNEYVAMRRCTSGLVVLTDLVEFGDGAILPARIRDGAKYAETWQAAVDVACVINDLLSLRKEIWAGEMHNLVLILSRARQCSLADAVGHATEWMEFRLQEYLRARDELLTAVNRDDRTILERHIAGLTSLVRGSYDWSTQTDRYRSPGTSSIDQTREHRE